MLPSDKSLAGFYNLDLPVSANFVLRCTGEYFDSKGSSRGTSNAIDRNHLVHLRSQAGAVVTGGTTARIEGYLPSSKFKTYVFSRSESLAGLSVLAFEGRQELLGIFELLCQENERVLVEVGPVLLNEFLLTGVIDTLFCTVVHFSDSCICLADTIGSLENTISIVESVLATPRGVSVTSFQLEDTVLARFDCGEPYRRRRTGEIA